MDRLEILLDLLDRWDETLAERSVTPDEFCHEYPELLDDFRNVLRQRGVLTSMLNGEDSPAMEPDAMIERLQSGRFPAVKFHDKGGLGWVYIARDGELGRTVALKCLQPSPSTDPVARQRFIREAEITARLEHPGVVPIYGLGSYGLGDSAFQRFPSYAMRFIQGETLRDTIRQFHASHSKIDWRSVEGVRILRSFVNVCETLAFAHSKNVIHRDLKSANVMLGDYGETLVLDWGLAKLRSETTDIANDDKEHSETAIDDNATQTGVTLGTVGFMSPEQARGDWDKVDAASDIFSLGAILYQILTNQSPYNGDKSLESAKACTFQPPQAVNPAVPKSLATVCLKAMQADPSNRYSRALDLKMDIERHLADEPITARPDTISDRIQRTLRKHRAIAQMAALMALAAILTLSAFLSFTADRNRQLELANNREEAAKNEAIRQRNRVREQLVQSVRENYAANMAQVSQALNDRQPERLKDLLNKARPRIGSPIDPRGIEWWMSWEKAFGEMCPIPINGKQVIGMRLLARGNKVIGRTDDQRLVVIDTLSGLEQFNEQTTGTSLEIWNDRPRDLPCSSDGLTLAIHKDSVINVYSFASGRYELTNTLENENRVFVTSVSHDGRVLVSGDGQGIIRVWDLASNEMRRFDIGDGKAIVRLHVSPDGRFLAYFGLNANGSLPTVLNLATGASTSVPIEMQSEFAEIAFGEYDTLLAWNKSRVVTFGIEFNDRPLKGLWETDLNEHFKFDVLHDPSRSIREWIVLTPDCKGLNPEIVRERIHSGEIVGLIRAMKLAVMLPKNAIKSETDYRQIGFRLFYREPIKKYSGNAVFDVHSKRPVHMSEFRLPNLEAVIDFSHDGETALIRSADGRYSTISSLAWSWGCIDRYDIPGPIQNVAWIKSDVLVSSHQPAHVYTNDYAEYDRCKTPFDQIASGAHRELTWLPSSKFSNDLSVLANCRENHINIQFGVDLSQTQLCQFASQADSFPNDTTLVSVFPWSRQDVDPLANEVVDDTLNLRLPFDGQIEQAKPLLSLPWILCVFKDESEMQSDQSDDKSRLSIFDYELSKVVHELDIPNSKVAAVALSDNGRSIGMVSGGMLSDNSFFKNANRSSQLHTWSVSDDRTIAKRPMVEIVANARCLTFNPACTQIAIGSLDGKIIVIDLCSGKELMHANAHEGLVRALTFSPDGGRLITAGDDKKVRFFSAHDWQEVMKWECSAIPTSLAVNQNGGRLAIGNDLGHIEIIAASDRHDVVGMANLWLKQESTAADGEDAILRELWAEFVTKIGRSEDELEAGLRTLQSLREKVHELSIDELRQRFSAELQPLIDDFFVDQSKPSRKK